MQELSFSNMVSIADRSSLGIDQLLNNMWSVADATINAPNFPPHEIVKTGEHSWQISMALAGFSKKDVSINVADNVLTISSKGVKPGENGTVLHGGIAYRPFKRKFMLGEFIEVGDASMKEGILKLEFTQELPENKKPKTVEIK